MGYVDVSPNSDDGGFPLLTSVTGAATRWQALSDVSDASYVLQETPTATNGIDIIGFATPSLPAGAVATRGEVWFRGARGGFGTTYSFSLHCYPKAAYQSYWAPDPYASCYTVLGTSTSSWWYVFPADGLAHTAGTFYSNTFDYNDGFVIDHLTWDQMDLSTMRMLIGYYEPSAGVNRLMEVFVRVYYDEPPVVSNVDVEPLTSPGITYSTTPTVTWDYTDAESQDQTQFEVYVVPQDSYDAYGRLAGSANFDPELATDVSYYSGIVNGLGYAHSVLPYGLTNLEYFIAYVRAWHAPINGNEMRSEWEASSAFLVDGIPPETPTITATPDNDYARINVDVVAGGDDGGVTTDFMFVQRSVNDTDSWENMRDAVNISTWNGLKTGSDAGNHISTPHHADFTITGDIDIRACVALEGAPNDDYIISKSHLVGGASWYLILNSSDQLEFRFNNGFGLTNVVSPQTIPFPSTLTPFWIRAKHNTASNWHTDFYYSLDPVDTNPSNVSWTSLGTFTSIGAGTITSPNVEVCINGIAATLQSRFRIYYAEVRNTAGALVANPDFRDIPFGTTSVTDATGKVWTIHDLGTDQTAGFVSLKDYEVNEGELYNYRAQAITLDSGSQVATVWDEDLGNELSGGAEHTWWFKVIGSDWLNYQFDMLPGSWDSTIAAEAAVFTPLSRTRKLVVSDGTRGAEQNLTVECMTEDEYDTLRAIYDAQQVTLVHVVGQYRYLFFTNWNDSRHTLANGYSVVELRAVEVDRPPV